MDTWNWLLTLSSATSDACMEFCVEQLRQAVPVGTVPDRLLELAGSSPALLAFYHREYVAVQDDAKLDVDELVASSNCKWVKEVSIPRLLFSCFVGSNAQQPFAFERVKCCYLASVLQSNRRGLPSCQTGLPGKKTFSLQVLLDRLSQ